MSSNEAPAMPPWLGILDRKTLMDAASVQTGLSDFGADNFIEPLDAFLAAATTEAGLGPEGFAATSMEVVGFLTNRLIHRRDQKAHPEIANEDVSDPIVIMGLPRTGTTKLQRVLACDPGLQSLPLWKAINPAPLPGSENATGPDPRIAIARQQSETISRMFPGFMASHPMQAEEPEEEILLVQMTFEARGTGLMFRVPKYIEWLDKRPARYQYEYLRDILRYLQWQDGGRRGRPWVLKSPPHLARTDEMFETFPGATVIRCHRDPVEVIPSLCKFMVDFRTAHGVASVDRVELGRHMLDFCAHEWARHLTLMDKLPVDRIIDIQYKRIVSDMSGVVKEIYDHRGVKLSAETAAHMRDWEQKNPLHGFGSYKYTLEQYGLTVDQVDAAFAGYLQRFPETIAQRT